MGVEKKARDLIKYVTIYERVFPRERCEELLGSFYTAPHGDGYLLEEANPWEDQEGLRRQPRLEYYRNHPELDRSILGGESFKDFDVEYPEVKEDDTAYYPMMDLLKLLKEVTADYQKRWGLDINIIQHAPLEFRYYQGPQGVGPHSDYSGNLDLHPRGDWGYQDRREDEDLANQTFSYNAYLNDDYGDGGELRIQKYAKNEDGTYKDEAELYGTHRPNAGDIVIFPCSFPYEHWVTPIGPNVKRWMVNANAIQDTIPMWQFD